MTDFFENLLSNGELQEKIAELKAYKDVNEDFKTAWEELKAENERLKEKIKMYKSEDTRKHNVIMETLQCEKKALDVSIKYKETLQEIKAIAETGMHCEGMGCDFMPQILDLITKAEEV